MGADVGPPVAERPYQLSLGRDSFGILIPLERERLVACPITVL